MLRKSVGLKKSGAIIDIPDDVVPKSPKFSGGWTPQDYAEPFISDNVEVPRTSGKSEPTVDLQVASSPGLITENQIKRDTSKVCLYNAKDGRAGRRALVLYMSCWFLIGLVGVLWLNAVVRVPSSLIDVRESHQIWRYIFVFIAMFSLVVYLINHSAPVPAAFGVETEQRKSGYKLLNNQVRAVDGTSISVGVVSIFCYERAFHILRNIIGVTFSWARLLSVCKELGFKRFHFVHYVVDNCATNQCEMAPLIRRLCTLFREHPEIDWNNVMHCLRVVSFEPSMEDYNMRLPYQLRLMLERFLTEIDPKNRPAYDPFGSEKPSAKGEVNPSELNAGEFQIDQNVTVEIRVLRSGSTDRSKVGSLRRAATSFNERLKTDWKGSAGYLAIMDARHMMLPEYWQYALPAFFVCDKPSFLSDQASDSMLPVEDAKVRLVQVLQYFPFVNTADDYFNRGNFHNYLYNNTLRSQIQAVTSCGTNALWSMRPRKDNTEFNFHGKTFIEDTETSHAFLRDDEDSIYISKPLSFGSVKEPEDYGEAPSRWAAGGVQLLFHEMKGSFLFSLSMLLLYFGVPALCTFLICNVAGAEWLFLLGWLSLFTATNVPLIMGRPYYVRKAARYLIRMSNTTYWFTASLSAIFWLDVLPVCILLSGKFLFAFNPQLLVIGGLVMNGLMWVITSLIKKWGNVEETHMWRHQQVWFALWPLCFCGIPRILNPGTSWAISRIQSRVTLALNLLQLSVQFGAMIYALFMLQDRLAVAYSQIEVLAATITGIAICFLSIMLLFPITSYLINFELRKIRRPFGTSFRHLVLLFLVAWIIVFYYSNLLGFGSGLAGIFTELPKWSALP